MTTIPMTLRASGTGPTGVRLDTYQVDQVVTQDDRTHTWWVAKIEGTPVAAFGLTIHQSQEGKSQARFTFAATPIVDGQHRLDSLELMIAGKIIETVMTAGRNAE